MPKTYGGNVLTYNPEDERLKGIIAYIREQGLPIYLSTVSGFGRPELRISLGLLTEDGIDIVEGVDSITQFLEKMK